MKFSSPVLLVILLLAGDARGAMLPGFRTERAGSVPGFATSIAIDSRGTVYATTTDGVIHRADGDAVSRVAQLPTRAGGNGGLLGMALVNDETAVVHYTTWSGEVVIADVLSLVDLDDGGESVLHTFYCDVDVPARGASDEHHGGNPIVAPDGSIFVGIGEYGDFSIAQDPRWNAGKIFRIHDGTVTQYARGLRNPYDLAWDPDLGRIVISDNGPSAGDEIHVAAEGDNLGWPVTWGDAPPVSGMVSPVYVFPDTVAPTGLARLTNDANRLMKRGYLSTAFVTRALYYFPTLGHDPHAVIEDFTNFLIDVTQAPNGDVYFVAASFGGSEIYRLIPPAAGDCDGNGAIDAADILAMLDELTDAESQPAFTAQTGTFVRSWGCDANEDGLINRTDVSYLARKIGRRRPSAKR